MTTLPRVDRSLPTIISPAKIGIDQNFTVSVPVTHSENTNYYLVHFRRLSDLADRFVYLLGVSQLPVENPRNSSQWNIDKCTNAILSIAAAYCGAQFYRSPNKPTPFAIAKTRNSQVYRGPIQSSYKEPSL